MGLHLHRAERADRLADELAAVLARAPADPFAPDVVAVPARGVERWLSQRLSHLLGSGIGDDGVAANVSFPSPARLIAESTAAASGYGADDDPWGRQRGSGVQWRLLDVIDAAAADPGADSWTAPLRRHLDQDPGRRLALASRLAALFGGYGEQRPQLLRDWLAGHDTDGAGAALPDDLGWQVELWRRLREVIGTASPAERLDDVCTRLRDEPDITPLPDRLSLFGPTRLTSDQVAVLGALAEHRDVHLWLPHPSAALWDRVADYVGTGPRPRRGNDPTATLSAHPLLSSLGRDAREMQLVLTTTAGVASNTHHRLPEPPDTLLGRLQWGLRHDQPPPGRPLGNAHDERAPLDPHDDSLRVHACHGRARQVEVLGEVLLGLLADDPSLEPRDVLVMCPDIESYAPLISATFGLADPVGDQAATHPGHQLRVRLADRSLRQTNPLLGTLSRLLDLADSRVTASQVMDLAASPPVRRRFRFVDDDLERVRGWVSDAGVRWGIDAGDRARYRLESVPQNTWRAGLDRVLVGVAMAEDELRWLGLALPLDDVDSSDIDLAGRLAELVDRLGAALDSLRSEQSLPDWLAALGDALAALTAVGGADSWQLEQAQRLLAEVGAGPDHSSARVRLTLGDVRAALAERLRGRPTRAGFRTGNLTMCSMVPMRSVPHRVICLLGLDDGYFPRTAGVDGDDILGRDPLVGERDRRSEDRQLLLDAVLAAQEHLVLVYTGADERTNAARPPAAPLGELLDVVDATVRAADGRGSDSPAREHVVVRHPLQPFDGRNFAAGRLGTPGPFSFDTAALSGARAAAGKRGQAPAFLAQPLPEPEASDTVELDRLYSFLEHPVRGFLRQRLGVAEADDGDQLDDALHPELSPLAKWVIGNPWLRQRQTGAAVETCRDAEWRRGRLPPGELGRTTLAEVAAEAEPLVVAAAEHRVADPLTRDVSVALPDGRLLAGTVASLHRGTLLRTEYSRLGAKHRLRAWVQLLALAACAGADDTAGPDGWQAVTIGRGNGRVRVARLTPPDRDTAVRLLQALVALRDDGLREPLPLPICASLEYARMRRGGAGEPGALAGAESEWRRRHEHEDSDHRTVWGRPASFDRVREQRATSADQPESGEQEATRFGALACRLWFPLLELESVGQS